MQAAMINMAYFQRPSIRRAAMILEGRGSDTGSQHKNGIVGVTPEHFLKNVHAIWCITILNLVNVKVLPFSLNLFETNIYNCKKTLLEIKLYYYLLSNILYLLKCNIIEA